jgi:hypothetical protein
MVKFFKKLKLFKLAKSAASTPGEGLTPAHKKIIEAAIKSAFDILPERLVKEMANIPPATDEVAKLYCTTADALEQERYTAVSMIAVHTVMEKLCEVRNQHWQRSERKANSTAIDTYAYQVISGLLKNENTLATLTKKADLIASKGLAHYTLGVSTREVFVLKQMTAALTKRCLTSATFNQAKATEQLKQAPFREQQPAFTAFETEMGAAMAKVFAAYDERVRRKSVVGVNHTILNRLKKAIDHPSSSDKQDAEWLSAQTKELSDALNRAASRLPQDRQEVWKNAYLQRFLVFPMCQLEDVSSTASAVWKLREARKADAKNARQVSIVRDTSSAWAKAAIDNLQAVMEEYSGCPVKGQPTGAEPDTTLGFRRTKPTLSDLRAVYDGQRSGVPWHDTREQDAIEEIAAPMMKKLRPEFRANTLEALATYGKKATLFFIVNGVKIRSSDLNMSVITEKRHQKIYGQAIKQQDKQTLKPFIQKIDSYKNLRTKLNAFEVSNLRPSSHSASMRRSRVVMSQRAVNRSYRTSLHELGHAMDRTLLVQTLPIYKKYITYYFADYISQKLPVLLKEHKQAKQNHTGITAYAETNVQEHFAEACMSYFVPGGSYTARSNVDPMGRAILSPENLKALHPGTYTFIDELMGSGFTKREIYRHLQKSRK